MKSIEELLRTHRFFEGLPNSDLDLLAGCGQNVVAKAGNYIAREGEAANNFYVIRQGKIALETQGAGRGGVVLETLSEDEVLGWSWLFPPHQWFYDVRVIEDSRLISMDGVCLRNKAEADPALGFRLMKTIAREMNERLREARLQVLDVYKLEPPRALE